VFPFRLFTYIAYAPHLVSNINKKKLKYFLCYSNLCIVGRCLDPQELFLVLAHRGGALGSEKKITEPVQIAPHLAIHQVVFYQRHHGALGPPADCTGKVKVRRT